ncbi:MAG TPA: ATP-binding protein, partial [Steroidobacteraceae bacterium]
MAFVMTAFVGRDLELAKLKELARLNVPSLVVIKGRRRVGKSRLATEFAARLSGYQSILITGMAPDEKVTAADEREDFASQLSRALFIPPPRADDWNTLLWALADRTATGKWVVILDEINWLGAKDATFLGKLKSAWDVHFSKNKKLILILSGSLSSWIERNILHSTGFVGRVHLDLTLDELPLRDCLPFLETGHQFLSSYEKFKIVAVTGGIPSYLERIDPASSADANIHRLCLMREGFLFREFDLLFNDLFQKKQFYRRLIAAVAERPLELEDIYRKLNVEKAGYISECIQDLIEAGFLARHFTWSVKTGGPAKRSLIRIIDNYTRFYFRCIKPNKAAVERGAVRLPAGNDGILGLQFENVILKNRPSVWKKLGIGADDIVFDNPYWQTATQKTRGCQIDYMIQCRNNTVYACEIKFSKIPLQRAVTSEVDRKIRSIAKPRNYTFRPVLIHVNGVDDSVLEERYFDTVIDLGELWS